MMIDLLGGRVSVFLDFVTGSASQVRSGAVRALATTGRNRSAALPDVPTAMESGLPAFEVSTWFGLFAPAGTPPEIVTKLNTELNAVLAMPAVQAQLNTLGLDVTPGGPKELGAYLAQEIAKWRAIITKAGIDKVD
jgi:tripartite-type tricarboxylate transporter receptor subunit TctC